MNDIQNLSDLQRDEQLVDGASKQADSTKDHDRGMKDYETTVTILESITDAIFILSARGKIEYANHSAQEYLQLPLEQIIGLDLDGFISSEDEEAIELFSQNFNQDASQLQLDQDMFSNSEAVLNGIREKIPVLINFSVIPDGTGQVNYIIVTAKEIGYRKSLEKELKNRQALSVSFDRLKALGEMSVGLVHTLGQPVTSMELRLDYVSNLTDVSKIQTQIAELRKDIGKVSGIVEKVRSYAQVMAHKENRSIDINKALQEVLLILEYDLRAAGVTVEQKLTDDLPPIEANEPELEQVFMNILTNAEQAFKVNDIDQHRVVTISTTSEENKWLQIAIEDNAGGISESVAASIFEPFFSTWDKRQHAGTGLSVARSILSSLGGDINYEGLDKGSSFILRIPIVQQEERTQLFNLIELLNN